MRRRLVHMSATLLGLLLVPLSTGPSPAWADDAAPITLTLSAPEAASPEHLLTISGTVLGGMAGIEGATVHLSRTDETDHTTTALPDMVTDTNGAFSEQDTTPGLFQGGSRNVVYTALFDGDSSWQSGSSSASVSVRGSASSILLPFPHSVTVGTPITVTGRVVTVSPLPSDAVVQVTDFHYPGSPRRAVPLGSDGSFAFTEPTDTGGSYVFQFDYAGDDRNSRSDHRVSVTVNRHATSLGIDTPAVVYVGTPLTVTGRVTFAAGVPANGVVGVTEYLQPGAPTVTVPLRADGSFSFTDIQDTGASTHYRVSYSGDATNGPSSAEIWPALAPRTADLTVRTDRSVYGYGRTAHVTVHLGPTWSKRTVSIYATPYRGAKTLLWMDVVDSKGDVVVGYRMTTATRFTAVFTGDEQYAPDQVSRTVQTYASIAEAQHGYYTTAKVGGTAYRVYHRGVRPVVTATVAPRKSAECVRFQLQEYRSHAWHTLSTTGCHKLSSKSAGTATLTLPGRATGHLFRSRALYYRSSTDLANLNDASGWQYFAVRK